MTRFKPDNTLYAFTLIEVTAVLVLLGLMAVGTVQLYLVKARGADLDNVMGRLALIDAQARQTALRTGRAVSIELDLEAGTVVLMDPTTPMGRAPFALPSTMKLDRVVTPRSSSSYGAVSVPVSAEGISTSYAVEVRCSDGLSATNLLAGLTGQATRYDGEDGWHAARTTVSSLDVD